MPGTFPETPQQEPETVSVNPLPATSGDGNPITIPAGEQLPPASDITASAIDSKVTTSKEDYEKAGQEEPESFSVKPIPASAGPGNPVDLPAGEPVPASGEVSANSVQSTVTTSKEDYEKAGSSVPFIGGAIAGVGAAGLGAAAIASSDKKENLIPESSLPLGADAGNTLDAGPTISSAAPVSTTADLAGKVPLEERKEAAIVHGNRETTDTVPEVVKESIAEAHTSPEATTSAEAVKEKAEVEQELLKKVPSSEEVGEPAPVATASTSSTAPAATLGTTSAAAAAVSDGTDVSEIPPPAPKTSVSAEKTEGDNTEYAPPHEKAPAPGVSPAAGAALSDGAEDPSLADEPAVQYLKQNDGAADTPATESTPATEAPAETKATEAPKEADKAEPTPGTPSKKTEPAASATPATPTSTSKKPATTPASTSSPASASKEKKKKHRISSLFKKIFD